MIRSIHIFGNRAQLALLCLLLGCIALDQSRGAAVLQPFVTQAVLPLRLASMRAVQWFQTPLEAVLTSVDKAQRIKDLQERYAHALVTITELEAVREENAQLRELLNQQTDQSRQQFLARPILSLSYPAVEGGTQDGLITGAVVTRAGVLVGRVSDVHERQSRVTLLSQKESTPLLASSGTVQGIVRGDGRRVLLTEIPKDVILTVGDRVSTVGQENVPAKLFIGTINSIENRVEAPTQTAVIEQPVSFFDAAIVEVW